MDDDSMDVDPPMDVDPSKDFSRFTTPTAPIELYRLKSLSEFSNLEPEQQKEVSQYMNILARMDDVQLQEELNKQVKKKRKARYAYSPKTKEHILELGKLRIVEAVTKNQLSDGIPKEDVGYRKVPNYLQEELLPQLDAYQKKIEPLPIQDLLREKDAQTTRTKNAIPDPTPFDKKKNLKAAKLEAIQEELKDRNSLKRKTLDHPSYPEAKMRKNSATITTPEEQTTYEHKLAEQEKHTKDQPKPKGMRF